MTKETSEMIDQESIDNESLVVSLEQMKGMDDLRTTHHAFHSRASAVQSNANSKMDKLQSRQQPSQSTLQVYSVAQQNKNKSIKQYLSERRDYITNNTKKTSNNENSYETKGKFIIGSHLTNW